jgi:chaperonin GroES
MKLRPLSNRVIVLPLEPESKTKSGIIIPDSAKEKSHRGKVLAVGVGCYEDGKLIPISVNIDDEVIYKEYAGEEFKLDGEKVMILKEEDIIAVIE